MERVDRSLGNTHGVGRTQEQERKERRQGLHSVFPEQDFDGKLVVQSVPIPEHVNDGLLVAEGIGRGKQHRVPETRLQKEPYVPEPPKHEEHNEAFELIFRHAIERLNLNRVGESRDGMGQDSETKLPKETPHHFSESVDARLARHDFQIGRIGLGCNVHHGHLFFLQGDE